MTRTSRRCSLQERHALHNYTMGAAVHECDGLVVGDRAAPTRPASQIRYVFPLTQDGRRAQVWLPEDLTHDEANRLQAIVETLPYG